MFLWLFIFIFICGVPVPLITVFAPFFRRGRETEASTATARRERERENGKLSSELMWWKLKSFMNIFLLHHLNVLLTRSRARGGVCASARLFTVAYSTEWLKFSLLKTTNCRWHSAFCRPSHTTATHNAHTHTLANSFTRQPKWMKRREIQKKKKMTTTMKKKCK